MHAQYKCRVKVKDFRKEVQEVVTYVSPVEAFDRIKMESSDQHSFRSWSRDQDELWV